MKCQQENQKPEKSKHLKDLSERFTTTVAVANAVLSVINDYVTQFCLST